MGKKTGIIYLVGAGPGDPKLLTLRGKECLERADVVLYDYLANPALLDFAPSGPSGFMWAARAGTLSGSERDQSAADREGPCRQDRRAAESGDPFVSGGGEEAEAVPGGTAVEVVPGVTSGGGAGYAGIPVTHRTLASQLHL